MSDPEMKPTPAEQQAASLDVAAEELERNGPVPPAEGRRTLSALHAKLDAAAAAE